MTIPQQANTYTLGGGTSPSNVPVVRNRAPTINDTKYTIGQEWVWPLNGSVYFLAALSGNPVQANWVTAASASGALNTLSDGTTTVNPTAGNIEILGTANQVTSTGSNAPGAITLSLPSAITAPGSLTVTSGFTVSAGTTAITGTTNINTSGASVTTIGTGGTGAVNIGNATGNTAVTGSLTASTTLTATLGNITATNGNLNLAHTGNKLLIHASTAASDSIGVTAAMFAGTITVSTTAVTASSIIFLTAVTPGGTQGVLSYGSIIAGTSFVITSSSNTDTSTVAYLIIN